MGIARRIAPAYDAERSIATTETAARNSFLRNQPHLDTCQYVSASGRCEVANGISRIMTVRLTRPHVDAFAVITYI